jgi:hypothetical protein
LNDPGEFLRQHLYLLFLLPCGWWALGVLRALFQLMRQGPVVVRVPDDAAFSERFVSGRSRRHNWWARTYAADDCLCVSLTRHELSVQLEYPYTVLPAPKTPRLEMAIPLDDIRAVGRRRHIFASRVRIDYQSDRGEARALELWLRNPRCLRTGSQ